MPTASMSCGCPAGPTICRATRMIRPASKGLSRRALAAMCASRSSVASTACPLGAAGAPLAPAFGSAFGVAVAGLGDTLRGRPRCCAALAGSLAESLGGSPLSSKAMASGPSISCVVNPAGEPLAPCLGVWLVVWSVELEPVSCRPRSARLSACARASRAAACCSALIRRPSASARAARSLSGRRCRPIVAVVTLAP